MTIEETEVDRIRYEDLSASLKAIIDDLVLFNDDDYVDLRTRLATVASSIDTNSSVHVGSSYPTVITLGKTVYFNSAESTVQIASTDGSWIYLK